MKLAEALATYDDLNVVSGAHLGNDQFTLCAIARNEMYFLPAFLDHYRRLGVQRFVILEDRSTDRTREYLCDQSDVVVVESRKKYGDVITALDSDIRRTDKVRMLHVWRGVLAHRFARGQWSLQVDIDEFLSLPTGTTLPQLTELIDEKNARVILGVILDLYPKNISELLAQKSSKSLPVAQDWFFDGQPHVEFRTDGKNRQCYNGARARLYHKFGLSHLYPEFGIGPNRSWLNRQRKTRLGFKIPFFNMVSKPALINWPEQGAVFLNSHETNLEVARNRLLPLMHYRFTGAIFDKIDLGVREKSYSNGSADHQLLTRLLKRMQENKADFTYRKSTRVQGFADFAATGNAQTS